MTNVYKYNHKLVQEYFNLRKEFESVCDRLLKH